MQEATVKVKGMTCRSCISKIEGAISEIGAEGSVNMEQGAVEVKFDESKVQISEIEEAIRNKGYNVEA
ncbi:heavy-metal-associated domain-containing protein [Paenibacillus yanchengensis]|uniref:Heavy-metal-associated domain-containing protein n=1 Tax=Paenibacillus yanchengensis TaxID=2035833 RepID=A0ABW4YFD7_9BACL